MGHAFLIMAARCPTSLECLIRALSSHRSSFYVHIDAKTDHEAFARALSLESVTLLSNRHRVHWGGFNMVLAQLELMKAALDHSAVERLTLLSDDSYPLHRPELIFERLSSSEQWIGLHVAESLRWRYDGFYCFDSNAFNPQHGDLKLRQLTSAEFSVVGEVAYLKTKGKVPISQLFHGSQWWSLTREAALYVLDSHSGDNWRHQSFRFSCIPDEHYIQTILGSSGRNWQITESPVYTDFSRQPKPYIFSDVSELESALASSKLFIRKVAQTYDFLTSLRDFITR